MILTRSEKFFTQLLIQLPAMPPPPIIRQVFSAIGVLLIYSSTLEIVSERDIFMDDEAGEI